MERTTQSQQIGLELKGGEIPLKVLQREYERLRLPIPFNPDDELLRRLLVMQITNRKKRGTGYAFRSI